MTRAGFEDKCTFISYTSEKTVFIFLHFLFQVVFEIEECCDVFQIA